MNLFWLANGSCMLRHCYIHSLCYETADPVYQPLVQCVEGQQQWWRMLDLQGVIVWGHHHFHQACTLPRLTPDTLLMRALLIPGEQNCGRWETSIIRKSHHSTNRIRNVTVTSTSLRHKHSELRTQNTNCYPFCINKTKHSEANSSRVYKKILILCEQSRCSEDWFSGYRIGFSC